MLSLTKLDFLDSSIAAMSKKLVNAVDNLVSGPSVVNPIYETNLFITTKPPHTARIFNAIMNQPQILYTGDWFRNAQYFNNQYADPYMTNGTVRLYSGTLLSDLRLEFLLPLLVLILIVLDYYYG